MVERRVRVVTRGSPLALAQVEEFMAAVRPVVSRGVDFEVRILDTPGDRDKKTPLGDPSIPDDFFTRDLDRALLAREGDLAVHSAKDLPKSIPAGLRLACLLPARDGRDALVVRSGVDIAQVRRIGASSPRREAAIRALFPDAVSHPIRGTIQERLAQLDAGNYDAVIVAACALERLGLAHRIGGYLPWETSPLQGHLAAVVRADDNEWTNVLAPLDFRKRLFDDPQGGAPGFKALNPGFKPQTAGTRGLSCALLDRPAMTGRSGVTLFLGTNPARFERYGPLLPWPMIRLEAESRGKRIAALNDDLPACGGVLFASPFAVRTFVDAVFHGPGAQVLEGRCLLAVGPSTAEAMERMYLRPEFTGSGYDGLSRLAAVLPAGMGGSFFYPCSSAAPVSERAAVLERSGIRLRPHVFYVNRPNDPGPLPTGFGRVLFSSPSTVDAFFARYPEASALSLRWLAVGPSTMAALADRGLKGELLHED